MAFLKVSVLNSVLDNICLAIKPFQARLLGYARKKVILKGAKLLNSYIKLYECSGGREQGPRKLYKYIFCILNTF